MKNKALDEISSTFNSTKADKNLNTSDKNQIYISLMNTLEKEFGSLILNPTDDDMKRKDVILYKNISNSRVF